MDGWSLLFILVFLLESQVANCRHCQRPFYFDSSVRSCYHLADDVSLTWREGRDLCRELGGDLLVINSPAEEDAMAWTLRKSVNRTSDDVTRWWIGLHRTNSSWRWVGGLKGDIRRVMWHLGQPDLPRERDVCVEVTHTLLNDVDCSHKRNVICEAQPINVSSTVTSFLPTLPTVSTSSSSEETEETSGNTLQLKERQYIFLAIISGIALLAIIAIFAVICLAVRVKRLKRTYQSDTRHSSFVIESREGSTPRPPRTLPRSDPGFRQFVINPPAYAEPETNPHPGYEKLRHTDPRYLEIVH